MTTHPDNPMTPDQTFVQNFPEPFDAHFRETRPPAVLIRQLGKSPNQLARKVKCSLFPRLHETIRKINRKIENRRLILKVKAEGCWLCGRKNLLATDLHFHHVDPKTKKGNIADLTTRSTQALIEEIRKCRLICIDDHKKHHAIIDSETWRTGGYYDL